MATISDSGEAIVQESMMTVSLPPLENDSVGEISLKKQVISSISEKDGEMIRSTSIEISISENEVMNTEVLSLLETDSTFLEEEKIGGDLQQFKETYAANVSLCEVSKEDDRFGDDVHKIEEVDDTDGAIDRKDHLKPEKKGQDSDAQRLLEAEKIAIGSISEVQGFEQKKKVQDSDAQRLLEAEKIAIGSISEVQGFEQKKKVQDSDAQRLLEAEKRRLQEVGTIFRKRVDVESLAGTLCPNEKLEKVEVKDNAFVKRSLNIELIDDTALVDVILFNKKAKDHPKRPVSVRTEKNAPRKYKKVGENTSTKVCGGLNGNGKQLWIMYSAKQMESMRYVNMANQNKLWSDLYASLLPEVVEEYEGLVSLKNQKTSKPNLRESGIGILGPISTVPRRNRVNVFVH